MSDDTLIANLMGIGFSKMESLVYKTLVAESKMGGYQIAKILNASRPSVYAALENLLNKGYITSIPGSKTEYTAVPPEQLIDELSKKYNDNAGSAKKALMEITSPKISTNLFANIHGKTNLITAVNRMVDKAEREIIFNSSMDLEPFLQSLKAAAKRNVRIILFSWKNLDTLGIPIEFYSGYDGNDWCPEERILMVADLAHCIAGSNDKLSFEPHRPNGEKHKLPTGENDYLGMQTDNRLLVNLISEHIHFDIYLQRLRKKEEKNLITRDIQLGTLMEKGI